MAVWDLVTGAATRALPVPLQDGYTVEDYQKGTTRRMAGGLLVREVVATGLKRRFTFKWKLLTSTQRGVVDNAVTDMLDGSTAAFTDPQSTSFTVVLAEEDLPKWEVRTVASTYYYSGSLKLEQV
jgi:hypothetical protein